MLCEIKYYNKIGTLFQIGTFMNKKNKQEQMQNRLANLAKGHATISGNTIYTFENHKANDLQLSKKSFDGKVMIPPRGRFQGDEYFLMFVRSGDARLVDSKPYLHENAEETNMQKLILDQPPKFTNQGQTEQVVVDAPGQQNLNEINKDATKNQPAGDVLLVENPMDGIDIIKS